MSKPEDRYKEEMLGSISASIDAVNEQLAPVYEGMRRTLLDKQFERTVEITTAIDQAEVKDRTYKHEIEQKKADAKFLLDFVGNLPDLTVIPENSNLYGQRQKGAFLSDSLFDLKVLQGLTVWSRWRSPYELGKDIQPFFIIGEISFVPYYRKKDPVVRLLIASPSQQRLVRESVHDGGGWEHVSMGPQLATIDLSPEEWEKLKATQQDIMGQTFTDEEIEKMSYSDVENKRAIHYFFPAFDGARRIQFGKNYRRKAPATLIKTQDKDPRKIDRVDMEDWNGVEKNLMNLAVAFGKTEELKVLAAERVNAITLDPMSEYLGLDD